MAPNPRIKVIDVKTKTLEQYDEEVNTSENTAFISWRWLGLDYTVDFFVTEFDAAMERIRAVETSSPEIAKENEDALNTLNTSPFRYLLVDQLCLDQTKMNTELVIEYTNLALIHPVIPIYTQEHDSRAWIAVEQLYSFLAQPDVFNVTLAALGKVTMEDLESYQETFQYPRVKGGVFAMQVKRENISYFSDYRHILNVSLDLYKRRETVFPFTPWKNTPTVTQAMVKRVKKAMKNVCMQCMFLSMFTLVSFNLYRLSDQDYAEITKKHLSPSTEEIKKAADRIDQVWKSSTPRHSLTKDDYKFAKWYMSDLKKSLNEQAQKSKD